MLDHIGFPVTDFARSKAFYARALEPLGVKLIMEVNLSEDGDGYAGFGPDRPHFWIGTGTPLTGRLHVAFAAKNRAERSPLAELTPREREVLAQIAEGKSNGAIADSLVLTKRAVEKHVNSIFSKLDLSEAEDASKRVKAALAFLSGDGETTTP